MTFDVLSGNLTFDLHYSNDKKAAVLRTWIRRVYAVSNLLGFSYSELWNLPEQEFLVLEELAEEVRAKREEDRAQLKESLTNAR